MHTPPAYPDPIPAKGLSDKHKRGIIISCVSAFPPLFSLLMFALIVFIGGIKFPEKIYPKSSYGEISAPADRSWLTLGKPFTISGNIATVPEDEFIYLVEHREKRYWPKKALGNQPGEWQMHLTPRGKKSKPLSYFLMKVDSEGKSIFEDWFKTARETGKYPGMDSVDFAQPVAKIRVKTQ